MRIQQKKWTKENGWQAVPGGKKPKKAQLTLVFGGRALLEKPETFEDVRKQSAGDVIMCSTAGEIMDGEVSDGTLALTEIEFEKSKIEVRETDIRGADDSRAAGERLSKELPKDGLVHAMVFSDGLMVNGTELVGGLLSNLAALDVSVTGGLVGDGPDFKKTLVGLNSAPASGKVVLVGFYGKDLRVGYGSLGGWDSFGMERTITKSKKNVLFELDGKPALQVYKEYLGDKAKELPSSGLLFPLSLALKTEKGDVNVVRTLLAVDEKTQSMTFAGDMPEGAHATLMKANFERLIDGAGGAAGMSISGFKDAKPELAVLISCIGRKLVLRDRIEEEIDSVRSAVGAGAAITGFYSYGEICPTAPTEKQCQLHNQTMTITTFLEA
ncbi:MAG: hypothetical protein RL272_933 [Candidatus Parcubacteria bacterium]|jgi:hypothetical protein